MMKRKTCLILWTLLFAGLAHAVPLGTAFTYQGELRQLGAPANGLFDFEFQLYNVDIGGIPITGPLLLDNVNVVDGVFTLELDFGVGPYAGDRLWLEIGIRNSASGGGYTGLLPRQALTAVPYALHSEMVAADAVGSNEIAFDSIQKQDIAPNAVGSSEIVDNSIVAADIATGGVASSEISDGSIGAADIDVTQIQKRISSACSAGSSIRSISEAGNVTCEFDSTISGAGTYHAEVFNGGSQYAFVPRTGVFCFLTRVSLRDVDAGSEDAWCSIYRDVSPQSIPIWVLWAYSEDDSDARCSMECVNY